MTWMHLWLATLVLLVLVVLALEAVRRRAKHHLATLRQELDASREAQAERERILLRLQMTQRSLQRQLERDRKQWQERMDRMEQQVLALRSLGQRPMQLGHLALLAEQGHPLEQFVSQGQISRAEAELINKLHGSRQH